MTRPIVMTDNKDMSRMFTGTVASQEVKLALNDPINKLMVSLGPTGYLVVNGILTISAQNQFKLAQDQNDFHR